MIRDQDSGFRGQWGAWGIRFGRAGFLLAVLALPLMGTPLEAQRRRGGGGFGVNGEAALYHGPNPPYDGRFTYARIKFTQSCCVQGGQYWDVKWGHDYPSADQNLPKILQELTSMKLRTDGSVIVTLDDPELFKYPFAYLCEVGYWVPNDQEVLGLRNYLLKGGFIIVDDFEGNHWYNFEEQMKRVFPELRPLPVDPSHPLFDSFYRIDAQLYREGSFSNRPAQFYGFFEDNDPKKRMMMIVNYEFDVGEFWEHSAEGFFPIALTNEAYKLGVNYVIYSLTR